MSTCREMLYITHNVKHKSLYLPIKIQSRPFIWATWIFEAICTS